MLATTSKEHPFEWESHIRKVCMAYNTSVHPTTGYTPFFLMFGRQARLPVDLMYASDKPAQTSHAEYATQVKASLENAYWQVRENMRVKLGRQKELCDIKVHGKPFEPDEHVWLHSPVVPRGMSRKLHHPWTGPWRIVKRISDATYRVQKLGQGRQRRSVVHFNRLKCYGPGIRLDTTPNPCKSGDPNQKKDTTTGERPVGAELEIVDTGDEEVTPRDEPPTRRYPQRDKRPPLRLYSDVTRGSSPAQ